jgi:Zn-dependent protease/CBS domain-containing protein
VFERKIPLFSLFGFKVGIDITWFILAVLVIWSLATGLFPAYFEGFSKAVYWWMGIAGAIGLFFSIVFHEFCHSLVARKFGLSMKGITLFLFGGVAEMSEEPASAAAEFWMASAGPASSVLLAVILFVIHAIAGPVLAEPVKAVIIYLAWLNIILAIFNLIPAFPLDGGRILRSILWKIKGNLRWATRISSQLGSAFGIFLIVLGVISFIGGNFIGGLWYGLIGLFIRGASQSSYQQMLVSSALKGEPVRRFMKTDVVTVPPDISVAELVQDYFYKHHYKMFPVSQNDLLAGCVTTKQVKDLPREQWTNHSVADIAQSCTKNNTVGPDTDSLKALSLMNRTGNSRLMVVNNNGRLEGIISLKDMLKFLSLKLDLESDEQFPVGTPVNQQT